MESRSSPMKKDGLKEPLLEPLRGEALRGLLGLLELSSLVELPLGAMSKFIAAAGSTSFGGTTTLAKEAPRTLLLAFATVVALLRPAPYFSPISSAKGEYCSMQLPIAPGREEEDPAVAVEADEQEGEAVGVVRSGVGVGHVLELDALTLPVEVGEDVEELVHDLQGRPQLRAELEEHRQQ
eukprot:scaffold2645_cov378-Prasinococcus_capsulatus_cf.AAC.10